MNGNTCDKVDLEDGEFIKELQVGWDIQGVALVTIKTSSGLIAIFGNTSVSAKESIQLTETS